MNTVLRCATAVALCLLPVSVFAAKKPTPLSEADAAALQGKTAAVTLHDTPTFVAMTAGKVGFGLFGVAAMAKAGNDFVKDNDIRDPSVLLRDRLGALLHEVHGLDVRPVDTVETKEKKPAALAALHGDADVVLSVRTLGWSYAYYPTDWSHYWIGYGAAVDLIDAKTGKPLSHIDCGADTRKSAIKPSLEEMRANGGQLTKDVLEGLGWLCVRLVAKEAFRIPDDRLPAIPEAYVDPLARLKPAGTSPTAPQAPAADASATPGPAEAPAEDAVADPAAAAATQPVAEPAAQPVAEPAAEPAPQPTTEPAAGASGDTRH